jgi:hypothetical protein
LDAVALPSPEAKAGFGQQQMKHEVKLTDEGEVYVTNVVKKPVESPEEFMALMNAGMKNRTTGATKMNDRSSRSHLVMVIDVEQHSM